jgi:hypothetical protein
MWEIGESMPGHHPAQWVLLWDDESGHEGGDPVFGIVPEIILQEERERVQRTSLEVIQRLRIIEIQAEIVGFMQNSAQRRLDDLEGIRLNR